MLMNNLPVIGYPCYAQRTLASPLLYGEKHSTSKTRDFGEVSTLFLAVVLSQMDSGNVDMRNMY